MKTVEKGGNTLEGKKIPPSSVLEKIFNWDRNTNILIESPFYMLMGSNCTWKLYKVLGKDMDYFYWSHSQSAGKTEVTDVSGLSNEIIIFNFIKSPRLTEKQNKIVRKPVEICLSPLDNLFIIQSLSIQRYFRKHKWNTLFFSSLAILFRSQQPCKKRIQAFVNKISNGIG